MALAAGPEARRPPDYFRLPQDGCFGPRPEVDAEARVNRTMQEDLEWNSFQNFDPDDPHWPIVLEMHDWTSHKVATMVVGIIVSEVLGYDVDVLDQMSLEAWMDDHDDAAGNATANTTILYNRVLDTVPERLAGCPGPVFRGCTPLNAADFIRAGNLPVTMIDVEYWTSMDSQEPVEARFELAADMKGGFEVAGLSGYLGASEILVPEYYVEQVSAFSDLRADHIAYLQNPNATASLPEPSALHAYSARSNGECDSAVLESLGLSPCTDYGMYLPPPCDPAEGNDPAQCGILYAGHFDEDAWVAQAAEEIGLKMGIAWLGEALDLVLLQFIVNKTPFYTFHFTPSQFLFEMESAGTPLVVVTGAESEDTLVRGIQAQGTETVGLTSGLLRRLAWRDLRNRSPMVWSILNDLVISNADIYNLTSRYVENGNNAYDAACGFLKDTKAWQRQVTCGKGEKLNMEHNLCEMCPPGTYNQWMHAQFCEPSPVGTYNDVYGGVFPIVCPIGTYAAEAGQRKCTSCPEGSYSLPGVKGGPALATSVDDCLSCEDLFQSPETLNEVARNICAETQKGSRALPMSTVIGVATGMALLVASVIAVAIVLFVRKRATEKRLDRMLTMAKRPLGRSLLLLDLESPIERLRDMLNSYHRALEHHARWSLLPSCCLPPKGKVPTEAELASMNALIASGADLRVPDIETQLQGVHSPLTEQIASLLQQYGERASDSPRMRVAGRDPMPAPRPPDWTSLVRTVELQHVQSQAATKVRSRGTVNLEASDPLKGSPFSLAFFGAQERWLAMTANPTFLSMQMVDTFFFDASHWARYRPHLGFQHAGQQVRLGPLASMGLYLLQRSDLLDRFHIDEQKLCRFLHKIEGMYNPNPYHNALHATDVLQTLHAILHRGGVAHYLDDVGLLACYVAAIIHDVGHTGVSNNFLIKTRHDLAVLYNDTTVQENMHLSSAFQLLGQKDYNFLSHLSEADFVEFRSLTIQMVMGTDMSRHFKILTRFQTAAGITSMSLKEMDRVYDTGLAPEPGSFSRRTSRKWDLNDRLLLQVAMKSADLGHNCERSYVHTTWVEAVKEEFFMQGDREQKLQFEVPAMNDRSKDSEVAFAKGQVAFQEVFTSPLYSSLALAFPDCFPIAEQGHLNYVHWRRQCSGGNGP